MKALKLALLTGSLLFTQILNADTLIIRADRVFTSTDQGVIENAAIVVNDGKISRIGPADSITAPEGSRVLQAAVVLPGLVDSHTLVGVSGSFNMHADQDGFESSDPAGAEYRVLDSFNPNEALVKYALKMGVTTLHVTPQPTAPIAGSSAIFKSSGNLADAMLIKPDAAMLFNLGVAPKSAFKGEKGPTTRMATAALIRAELYKARDWLNKKSDKRQPDLALKALAAVLTGDMQAIFTARREDDIATALRIAREFDLQPIIAYGTEAYLMRKVLADNRATVVLAPTMQRVSGMENANGTLEAATLLEAGNVPYVFATGYEAYVPKTRVLLWEVSMAIANGLEPETAVRAATIVPATLWGIDDRVGSLAKGKDADMVLFDGDPFEYTTHVQQVIVDGEVIERQ